MISLSRLWMGSSKAPGMNWVAADRLETDRMSTLPKIR